MGKANRDGRAGRRLAVHQQFEPPWLQGIEPSIRCERENGSMIEGPYAVMAAGADPLVLAAGEPVRLVALNDAKAIEPVCADKIVRAFGSDKNLRAQEAHVSAARAEIIPVVAAEDIPADGRRRREPGINIDISVIRIGERNIKLPARGTGFAERCGDVAVGDDLMDDRALGEQIVP